MPREGTSYNVDQLWRDRVRERLAELGKKPAWLAAESGCPRSMLSELLAGKRQGSTYVPEIHEVLGWPPPLGPLLYGACFIPSPWWAGTGGAWSKTTLISSR